MGKILSEGRGEIQEFIDIADYATGLSRMFSGSIIPSERKEHILLEQWNPLGIVSNETIFFKLLISKGWRHYGFQFSCCRLWSVSTSWWHLKYPILSGWNAALALVCGDALVWKPAPTTPLTAIAITRLVEQVLRNNGLPPAISSLVCGESDIGLWVQK